MGGVMCSAIVSEELKIRKSLGIYCSQDTISGVKVNNNVININKVWGVSTTKLTFPCSESTIETLKKRCKICSKLIIKTPEFGAFIVNFGHISHLFL